MSTGAKFNYQLAVFDLDGTLIQSHNTIYQSVLHSLNKLGIRDNPNKSVFMKHIGHHFFEIFEATGMKVNNFDEFMKHYKAAYFEYMDISEIYPGVEETLGVLKDKGVKIALLTTKLQDQADKIIDHFKLRKYFNEVAGRRKGVANKPSGEPLLKICKTLSTSPEFTLMVGDTELDIQCGKNAGTGTCAVTYGYRDLEQLNAEKPDFLINRISELTGLIKQQEA